MDYTSYLIRLFRPMGVYDLSEGSLNAAELAAWGEVLNEAGAELEWMLQDGIPVTAGIPAIEKWLALLPFSPQTGEREALWKALARALQIRGETFDIGALNDVFGALIPGAGLVAEGVNRVRLELPESADPEEAARIAEYLLPAQIAISK